MDIQANIILEIENKAKNENKKKIFSLNNNFNVNTEKELFYFYEYESINICLESNDKDAYLKLYEIDEEVKKLKVGEIYQLSSINTTDKMLVPGNYVLKVKTINNSFETYFTVRPSAMSWEGLTNMRVYLESILKGLSHDVYKNKNIVTNDSKNSDWGFLEFYKYIEENYKNLDSILLNIFRDPIREVTKKYSERDYSNKVDLKSQRWLVNKGMSLNSNTYNPTKFYEKHTDFTKDNYENKWLKKILSDMFLEMKNIENYYYNLLCKVLREEQTLCEKRSFLEEKDKNRFKSELFSKGFMKDRIRDLKEIDRTLLKIDKRKKNLNYYLSNITKLRDKLAYYINDTWLKEINGYKEIIKPSFKVMKDRRYSEVYHFYEALFELQDKGNSISKFPYKNTPKLFEYYVFLTIKQIIEDFGFRWMKGWLMDKDETFNCFNELPKNTKITLEKDNYTVSIQYEKRIEKNPTDLNNYELISNAYHRSPDIIVSIFKDSIFLESFIVEVKCRKFSYIYNEYAQTDTIEQVRDYLTVSIYDKITKRVKRNCINRVIIVYPMQDVNSKIQHEFYDINFIGIKPSIDCKKSQGYMELKNQVNEIMSFYNL
ncbi:DUF2357 domain-containing protein [Hathewaya limosa]|uniref:DUF2357 domain-containing protein n=1 Tax=Hathewaya limosa TaxID=1536 RepID=A0ABU0JUU0_HATLI|nr:DUF2357 domain-containing protein [Hathewaya limosa]MDQ0479981.1 hypothetical protein [Hathewaya limosa]